MSDKDLYGEFYYSDLLKMNYGKYIKFKDVFSEKIKYTQQEIDRITKEFFKGSRSAVIGERSKSLSAIDLMNNKIRQDEIERMRLIPVCLKLIENVDGIGKYTYLDLMVFEKFQLEEIKEYYSKH